MKRIAIVACFLLLACVQAGGQFFQSVDEWLQKRQQKQPYDTTYIFRPQERWRLRTTAKVEGESVLLVAVTPDIDKYGLNLNRLPSISIPSALATAALSSISASLPWARIILMRSSS